VQDNYTPAAIDFVWMRVVIGRDRKYDAAQKAIRDGEFNNFKALMGRFDEEGRLLNDEHDIVSRIALLRERQVTVRALKWDVAYGNPSAKCRI
jgi:hypothetical protein